MNENLRRLIWVVSLVMIGLAVGGCQSGPTHHEKAVSQADQRWRTMRSHLLLQTAQRQFDAGDLEQTAKTLTDAINRAPKNGRLHLLAGRLSLEQGRLERSFHQLALACELNPKLAAAFYFQGIVLQRWQQYDAAQDRYAQAFKLEPDSASYLMAVVEMYLSLDQAETALALLKSKVVYFDQNAGIRTALAELYRMEQDYDHAIEYYREASLLSPDDPLVVEELGRTLMLAGDYGQAIKTLTQLGVDTKHFQHREIQLALAKCYLAESQWAQAREVYFSLRRRDARDVEAWLGLGQVAYRQGDWSEVLRSARRVQTLASNRAEGYMLGGLAWQKRGFADRAAASFEQAAACEPNEAEPMLMRGLVLERAGRTEAAAEAYAEAVRRQPNDPRARQLLARLSAGLP